MVPPPHNDAPVPLALRLLLAGTSAVTAQLACQPIETVKVRLQLFDSMDAASPYRGYSSFTGGARLLVQSEGVAGLWKGMLPSALREMSYSSLRYGLFVPTLTAIQGLEGGGGDGPPPPAAMWQRFLAGGIAGGVGAAVANPADLLKARMQVELS